MGEKPWEEQRFPWEQNCCWLKMFCFSCWESDGKSWKGRLIGCSHSLGPAERDIFKWLIILGENWANIESVTKECGARVTVTALPIVILVVVVAPVHHPWGRVVIQVVAPSRHPLVPLHPLPHTGHLVGSKACGLFTQIVSLGPAWCTGLMVLESLFLLDTAGSTRTRLISRTYCMQRSKRLSLATRVLANVLYITQKI